MKFPGQVKEQKLFVRDKILKNNSTERLLRERDQYTAGELKKDA
jgi:hypothetical protein